MTQSVEIIKGTSIWLDAWKRLRRNRLAFVGLVFVVFMVFAVIVGPFILELATGYTYDSTPANTDLQRSMGPSFGHLMGTDDQGRDMLARVLQGGRISLMVGLISTIVSLGVGVSFGAIAGFFGGRIDNFMMRIVDIIYAIPYILIVIVLLSVFGGPNTRFLIEWSLSILSGGLVLLVGVPLSVVFYRWCLKNLFGKIEGVLIYLIKIVLFLIVAIILLVLVSLTAWLVGTTNLGSLLADFYAANLSQGVSQIFLLFFALGLVSWLTMARVVRGQILSLKNQEFVMAAKATGVSIFGIIFRHLVPNALGPVIVYATLTVPGVMLTEAFLSFLGLGVQAPYASWGSLADAGVKNLAIFPWQLLFPGVTMALTLFSLNFLGDGLRDALDPQTRKF